MLLPECRLDELLAAVREDDTVVVNRLARLGRNMVHTIQLVEEFNRRGVHFRALDLGIDSRTPAGKMIIGVFSSFKVFSSFNQYERENNRQKSLAGIALAKQQGKHLGRPAVRDAEKVAKMVKALERVYPSRRLSRSPALAAPVSSATATSWLGSSKLRAVFILCFVLLCCAGSCFAP